MSVQATNLYLMHSWELAYAFAGEAVLPLFGLSGGDIDAVLTVDAGTRTRWAATSPALALPRPGLLAALRGNDRSRLGACPTQGHGRATISRLVQPINVHLLTVWQQAAGNPGLCESFGLTAGELAALKGVDAAARPAAGPAGTGGAGMDRLHRLSQPSRAGTMNAPDINLFLLQQWRTACHVAGPDILPLFGLTPPDMAALTAADEPTLRRWASLSFALHTPRPGLLATLRARNRPRLLGYIAQGRSLATMPMLTRFPQPANAHLLATWRQSLDNAQLAAPLELDRDDRAALAKANAQTLERWSHLPIALATPRPGLLSALQGDNKAPAAIDPPPSPAMPSTHRVDARQLRNRARHDAIAPQQTGEVQETLTRYHAMRLMEHSLLDIDARHVCNVSDYFVRKLGHDLSLECSLAAAQSEAMRRSRHRGRNRPGVWSLCCRPTARLEAAMFTVDWALAGLPFTSRPHPGALLWTYERYLHWGWEDEQRQTLDPSSCLSVLRLVQAGELTLARCLLCMLLFVHPAAQSQVIATERCPFCGSPHREVCGLDQEQRLVAAS